MVSLDNPLKDMRPHFLRRLCVPLAADVVDLPSAIVSAFDSGDGELVLAVNPVECVFAADNVIEEFFEAEVVDG